MYAMAQILSFKVAFSSVNYKDILGKITVQEQTVGME